MRKQYFGFIWLAGVVFVPVGIPGREPTSHPAGPPATASTSPVAYAGPSTTTSMFARIDQGRWRVFVFHPESGVVDVTDGFPARWPTRTPAERHAAEERWRGLRPPRRDQEPPPEFARRWGFRGLPDESIRVDPDASLGD